MLGSQSGEVVVGFLVNPVAGMGGSVALKGTDGAETLRRARELGAEPHSPLRMGEALDAALEAGLGAAGSVRFLSCGGAMGEDLLDSRGLRHEQVFLPQGQETNALDTQAAIHAMAEAGASLIFFAGGDGTARDVCAALDGLDIPVLGVPAGVKIHSSVYGVTPRRAGQLLAKFCAGQVRDQIDGEVMDIDEDAFREGVVKARLYGYVKVLLDRGCMQDRKSGGTRRDGYDASSIGVWLAEQMKPGRLYLLGSGTTTRSVTDALNLPCTLLGVDAVKDKQLVGRDLTERQLLNLIEPGNTTLIVTVIGGQGHIFGRGNQQLSPAVLRKIGTENIIVAATPAKLNGLFGKPLLADTGDSELDRALCGYVAVVTGYGRSQMHRVEC